MHGVKLPSPISRVHSGLLLSSPRNLDWIYKSLPETVKGLVIFEVFRFIAVCWVLFVAKLVAIAVVLIPVCISPTFWKFAIIYITKYKKLKFCFMIS